MHSSRSLTLTMITTAVTVPSHHDASACRGRDGVASAIHHARRRNHHLRRILGGAIARERAPQIRDKRQHDKATDDEDRGAGEEHIDSGHAHRS